MPKKFPPKFKRDLVTIARRGELSRAEVAADFGISEQSVNRWMRQADIDDGVRDGLTTAGGHIRRVDPQPAAHSGAAASDRQGLLRPRVRAGPGAWSVVEGEGPSLRGFFTAQLLRHAVGEVTVGLNTSADPRSGSETSPTTRSIATSQFHDRLRAGSHGRRHVAPRFRWRACTHSL